MSKYIDPKKIDFRMPCECDEDGEILVPLAEVKKCIAMTPAEDVVKVKHGRWIYKYKGTEYDDIAYCSLCNFYAEDKINNIGMCFLFCPHCGARMDGDEK